MKLQSFNGIIRISCPPSSSFDLFQEISRRIDFLRPATRCDFGSFAKSDWIHSPDFEKREECRIPLLAPDQEQATVLLQLLADGIEKILHEKHPGLDAHRIHAYIEV